MLHEEITKDIIWAAMAVLNGLKPGLDGKLYERALVIELQARGHTVEQQSEFPVYYRGQFIGKLVPDLIVDGKVIADPKVATAFTDCTHSSDDWLPEHHRPRSGPSIEFQGCEARVEADRQRNEEASQSSALVGLNSVPFIRAIRAIRGQSHPCNPRHPRSRIKFPSGS